MDSKSIYIYTSTKLWGIQQRFLRFWHLAAVFTPSDVSWGNRWSAPSRRSCNANPGRIGRQRHTWSYLRYLEISKDYLCCLGEFTWGWFFDKNSFLRPTHIEAYQHIQQAEQVQADNVKKLQQRSISESAEMGVNMKEGRQNAWVCFNIWNP